jgi:ubiquinone/menaquinone biosynthesis C-methylase UbiE
MQSPDMDEIRSFWDRVAEDWNQHVGMDGDANRILNSDPVLWAMAGDVHGRDVLDAGCGTGYLSARLRGQGARVVGVDLSEKMIQIARDQHPDIDFRVDSISELTAVGDAQFDLVVSNYVLMDIPDLDSALRNFARVLRPRGAAVAVFSHPCFPQGRATQRDGQVTYVWSFPYFERRKRVDPPWGRFTSEFIWFHRPLSDYWKAFRDAGFRVVEFEEPHARPERYYLASNPEKLHQSQQRPYSVAFRLERA